MLSVALVVRYSVRKRQTDGVVFVEAVALNTHSATRAV